MPQIEEEGVRKNAPTITVHNADQVQIDDGNNADTEGWPVDNNQDADNGNCQQENNKDPNWGYEANDREQVQNIHGFEPDSEFDYAFDENLHCMIYTGPQFQVGDFCDAMKIEPDITETIQCWEQAQVVSEDDKTFFISFNRDDPKYNRQINKEHFRTLLFKLETHTRHEQWKYASSNELLGTLVEYFFEPLS